MPNTNEQLMSPSEAGLMLGVTDDTVIDYVKQGLLIGQQYRKPGGRWYVERASVLALKNSPHDTESA